MATRGLFREDCMHMSLIQMFRNKMEEAEREAPLLTLRSRFMKKRHNNICRTFSQHCQTLLSFRVSWSPDNSATALALSKKHWRPS
jgi:hypothetical protein